MRVNGPTTQPLPMVTFGPMTAYAPTTTSDARSGVAADDCCGVDFRPSSSLRPVDQHAEQLGLGDELAVDGGLAVNFHRRGAAVQDDAFEPQLIAGNDRTAEARLVDAAEEEELLLAVGHFAQPEDGRALRHGLDDQNAGHDRIAGKVSLEELLVGRDVFQADDPLAVSRSRARGRPAASDSDAAAVS